MKHRENIRDTPAYQRTKKNGRHWGHPKNVSAIVLNSTSVFNTYYAMKSLDRHHLEVNPGLLFVFQ
jgi:hypothetical protein